MEIKKTENVKNIIKSIDTIASKEGHHKAKSFEFLLDYIAYKSNFQENLKSFISETTICELDKVFNKNLFMVQREDYLGCVYEELGFGDFHKGQYFTPMHVCDLMAQITVSSEPTKIPVTICDPCVGTGRMLLAAFKVHGYKGLYFGCEVDRLVYKMAVMNAYFWQIPMFILNANALYVDLSPTSKNWIIAGNLWEPPSWDTLEKTKTEKEKKEVLDAVLQNQQVVKQMNLFEQI